MATKRDDPAPTAPETLSELNARISEAAAAVTTAEARGGAPAGGLVAVTTADTPPS
jgi:hypothetical protein